MSNNVPFGWGDRHNTMSEKDMALGGAAATKFAAKAGAYHQGDQPTDDYKSSEDVRAYYLSQMNNDNSTAASTAAVDSSLPLGWGQREKEKEIMAKQQGVFAASNKHTPTASAPVTAAASSSSLARE